MFKQRINLNELSIRQGRLLEAKEDSNVYLAPENGLQLVTPMESGPKQIPAILSDMKYLVIELESLEEHSLTFNVDLYRNVSNEEYDMRITFSILPHMMVKVPIDLEVLNSQNLFPPRTEGRLRMMIYGKPILREEIETIQFTTCKCYKEQKVRIKSIYTSTELPKYSLPDIKSIDELGQWSKKEWTSKVMSREECNKLLHNLLEQAQGADMGFGENRSKYGGWRKNRFDKTGWFHTVKDGKRWWLADPDGYAFFSTGVDCIHPGTESRVDIMHSLCTWMPDNSGEFSMACESRSGKEDSGMKFINYGIANLIAAFGKEHWWESWAKITKMYLQKWGINTIANWSSLDFIKWAKMPYVLPLDEYSSAGYPSTEIKIFRDFPDVYAKEYTENSKIFAQTLKLFCEDEYMIGYFMRNEPNWGFVYDLNIAEEMLANPQTTESKKEFVRRMNLKYKEIGMINEAWESKLSSFEELYHPIYHACRLSKKTKEDLVEFSKDMIRRYVEIPAKECKAVDHNHLNLGMRYAYITDPVMLSGYENFDVYSINCYQINPLEQIDGIGKLLDMPVMIGEFHFGALDKGLTAHGIRGVKNQEERGVAYRYYLEQGIKSNYFLGAHYFMLNDQSPIGRFDGENYQIGLIDICMQEYKEMTEILKECHEQIYEVLSGDVSSYERVPEEIPAVHC